MDWKWDGIYWIETLDFCIVCSFKHIVQIIACFVSVGGSCCSSNRLSIFGKEPQAQGVDSLFAWHLEFQTEPGMLEGSQRLSNKNSYWPINLLIIKDPQFWSNQAEILAILPIYGIVSLTKFHDKRKKILISY